MARERDPHMCWRKSSASGQDDCVEVAIDPSGQILVRNSRSPGGPVVSFTEREWAAFLLGVSLNEFDVRRLR